MFGPADRLGRRERRRRSRRRQRLLLGALALAAAGTAIAIAVADGGGSSALGPRATTPHAARVRNAHHRRVASHVVLVDRPAGRLAAALQDPSTATVGGRLLLFGGLTAADVSTDQIVAATRSTNRVVGHLPSVRHDTAAVAIGRAAYVFGGGDGGGQLDQIVRVDAATGQSTVVGTLPAASSDSSAAAIGGTAYIVGGFTGSRWLDTIVAWRPGEKARVVARLPSAVRYAAVGATDGRLIVAGGSLENGQASRSVYAFTPGAGAPRRIASLPSATTHAAATGLGPDVYVIGGRGATIGTPTRSIEAIDVKTGRLRSAGRLRTASSDLGAATVGHTILVAGGRAPSGTTSFLEELVPKRIATRAPTAARTGVKQAVTAVYAHDRASMLAPAARLARSLVYVPNSRSNTVDVIDPRTYHVVEHFAAGALPQHVVPAWDLRTLYVTNDEGNTLTPIDPRTGRPGRSISVADPYNMYFTPDGRHAIVVAERLRRLDFRNPHTFALQHSLSVPCSGVDHIDFSADGSYLVASCEFSGQLVKVDLATETVVGTMTLPDGAGAMPQDVKLSADGRIFYVADMMANGVWKVDGVHLRTIGFVKTGAGAHGLYPSRDARLLYVTNREAGSISVISFASGRVVSTWHIPGGGSPDMGGVSADGKVLWVSGRYNGVVYAISTASGRLLAKIPVGSGPHGLCVWPQPGRYSLGHTGIMR